MDLTRKIPEAARKILAESHPKARRLLELYEAFVQLADQAGLVRLSVWEVACQACERYGGGSYGYEGRVKQLLALGLLRLDGVAGGRSRFRIYAVRHLETLEFLLEEAK